MEPQAAVQQRCVGNHVADVVQLLVIKEEFTPKWSSNQDQEDPVPAHIQEEQEDLWISKDGEQLKCLQETDITRFPFTAVSVKSEDDEEKPQSSQLHQSQIWLRESKQIKTETDGEDSGGSDVVQLLVIKEEFPPEWSSNQDQEDPEPLHIKEEQEELWISKEEEQVKCLQDTDITNFPFTAASVKSEDDEEKPLSSQLHQSQIGHRESEQIKTETDGEDSGGSEPGRNLNPKSRPQPDTDEKTSDSSETDVSDNDWQERLSDADPETEDNDTSWKETMALDSGVNTLIYKEAPVSDVECNAGKKTLKHMLCQMGKMSCLIKKAKVDSHKIVYTGEKPFGCDICGKKFDRKSKVDRHMIVHTGEKPFGCDVCGIRFKSKSTLMTHMKDHTGEKPFGCDVCGKRFKCKLTLKRHMKDHTGEKPFGCDVCGKRFNYKSKVEIHKIIHTGEKPFGCDVCGKRYYLKSDLMRHTSIHTGEKPFGCDVCGKKFIKKANLEEHKRVHAEKPFGCDVCGKKFNIKSDLERHTIIHTGEKPFGCDVCGKRFNRPRGLMTHLRFHSG